MDLIKRFMARTKAAIALYVRYAYVQPNNLIRPLDRNSGMAADLERRFPDA
jgi:hypothetical protein